MLAINSHLWEYSFTQAAMTPQTELKFNMQTNSTDSQFKIETINDWTPETKALIERLIEAKCEIVKGNNGEEVFKFDPADMQGFIDNLSACEESHLFVKTPTSKKAIWIYLVYGNNPGELPSDYIVDDTLDAVTKAHYDEWELKGQPKKRGYYDRSQGYKFIIADTVPAA